MTAQTLTLAHRILAGNLPGADYPLWTNREWREAARMAIDCEDDSELRFMLEREQTFCAANEQAARDAYRGIDRQWDDDLDARQMRLPDRFVTPRSTEGMVR